MKRGTQLKRLIFSILCLTLYSFSFLPIYVNASTSTGPNVTNSVTITHKGSKCTPFGVKTINTVYPSSHTLNDNGSYYQLDVLKFESRSENIGNKGNMPFVLLRFRLYDNYNSSFKISNIETNAIVQGGILAIDTSVDPKYYYFDEDGYFNLHIYYGNYDYQFYGIELRFTLSNSTCSVLDDYELNLDLDYYLVGFGEVADFYSYVNYFLLSSKQSSSADLNDRNEVLDNGVNEYNDASQSAVDNFNNSIRDIDVNPGLIQISDFTTSALWLSNQMTRLVTSNVNIQMLVMYSLLFGFALVLIGRGLK